jgi:hypothetical protein
MHPFMTLAAGAALLPGILSPGEEAPGGPALELWIFVSPEDPDLGAALGSIERLRRDSRPFLIRPCLLAEGGERLKRPTEIQVRNIQALRRLIGPGFGLVVADSLGLARARELGIQRLPAFALLDPKAGRAHVAYGTRANVEDLFRCE